MDTFFRSLFQNGLHKAIFVGLHVNSSLSCMTEKRSITGSYFSTFLIMHSIFNMQYLLFYILHGVWKSQKKVSFNMVSEANYVYILSKMPKMLNLASFWKRDGCGQTVLPDMSILIGQKLVENAKIKISNETFWVIFKQFALGQRSVFW